MRFLWSVIPEPRPPIPQRLPCSTLPLPADTPPMSWVMQFVRPYNDPRIRVLVLLGAASGIPFVLTGDPVTARLAALGFAPAVITAIAAAIQYPYAIKFLWSPLVDRYALPWLSRRRDWLLITQILLLAALVGFALAGQNMAGPDGAADDSGSMFPFARADVAAFVALGVVVCVLSATQDIAADAYRADILDAVTRGPGSAAFVLGYRLVLLVVGWVALSLAATNWSAAMLISAAVLGLVALPATLIAPPTAAVAPPISLLDALWRPLVDFATRLGWRAAPVLGIVLLYRLPDALLASTWLLILKDAGYDDQTVAGTRAVFGLVALFAGVFVGGALASRLSPRRMLVAFGLIQAVSNAAYGLVTLGSATRLNLIIALGIENFCSGLVSAGFVAFLLSLCNARFSAAQYALLTSALAFVTQAAKAASGRLAEWMFTWSPADALAPAGGWTPFILASVVAGLPGLLLVVFLPPSPQNRS